MQYFCWFTFYFDYLHLFKFCYRCYFVISIFTYHIYSYCYPFVYNLQFLIIFTVFPFCMNFLIISYMFTLLLWLFPCLFHFTKAVNISEFFSVLIFTGLFIYCINFPSFLFTFPHYINLPLHFALTLIDHDSLFFNLSFSHLFTLHIDFLFIYILHYDNIPVPFGFVFDSTLTSCFSL